MSGWKDERGSVTMLAMMWIVCAVVLAIGIARVGTATVERARASTAADAAALAGAAAGDAGAREAAIRNGARVVHIDRRGDRVLVRVRHGDAEAQAAAELVRVRVP